MSEKLFRSPIFETTITKAIFIHQDLVVYPGKDEELPENFYNVIKFLFGKGVRTRRDILDVCGGLTIENACYELRNVRTINADWIYKEVIE